MAGNFKKVGKWGECLWGLDENGNLLIDGGLAADLGDEGAPWAGYEDAIKSVVATRGVTFPDGTSLAGLFKGCRNAYFKYGGVGVDFAYPLKRAGLLSYEEEEINGRKVIPFEVILSHIPPAPKYHEEIKEIIEEGIVSDGGAAVVECYGKKDGKDILVEAHVNAPGLVDSFEKSGLTAETYLTGQGGFLFSKLFVNGQMNHAGLITSDMLTDEENELYLKYAAELDITVDFIER